MRGLPVHKLGATPVVKDELDWFYMEAESAMGIGSSFAPLAHMALTGLMGTSKDPADMSAERRVAAVHAERTIRGWIGALDGELRSVLAAAYEPRQWAPEIERSFKGLAGLAVHTCAARRGFARDSKKKRRHVVSVEAWLASAIAREDRSAVGEVRAEAEALMSRAVHAYGVIRGSGPSVVPVEAPTKERAHAEAA